MTVISSKIKTSKFTNHIHFFRNEGSAMVANNGSERVVNTEVVPNNLNITHPTKSAEVLEKVINLGQTIPQTKSPEARNETKREATGKLAGFKNGISRIWSGITNFLANSWRHSSTRLGLERAKQKINEMNINRKIQRETRVEQVEEDINRKNQEAAARLQKFEQEQIKSRQQPNIPRTNFERQRSITTNFEPAVSHPTSSESAKVQQANTEQIKPTDNLENLQNQLKTLEKRLEGLKTTQKIFENAPNLDLPLVQNSVQNSLKITQESINDTENTIQRLKTKIESLKNLANSITPEEERKIDDSLENVKSIVRSLLNLREKGFFEDKNMRPLIKNLLKDAVSSEENLNEQLNTLADKYKGMNIFDKTTYREQYYTITAQIDSLQKDLYRSTLSSMQ